MKVRKAVITAAGWGTRFLPITKSQPKEMLPLLNKPIIQYSVEEAIACGIELVVIVTALGKRAIEDYFDRHYELECMLEQKGETEMAEQVRRLCNMVDICYVRQKEQLGLGHALLMARSIIGNEPFVLFLPDDIFENQDQVLRQMLDVSERYEGSTIAVKRVNGNEVSRYGIIEPNKVAERVYRVANLVEKPALKDAPSNLAIMGRYVLMPEIFDALERTLPGKNREIQLTDALQKMLRHHPIYGYEFEGERYDAGTLNEWLKTTVALALNDPQLGPELRDYIAQLDHPSPETVSRDIVPYVHGNL
ncbi:MAG: UTP--glucose-1-phosphate uridylyltransferase GalU [Chloroflexi bacterium]|nr:UTP--glucose-1-phosphate uridylyltransferase GalU [Chloroflexota bacterium]